MLNEANVCKLIKKTSNIRGWVLPKEDPIHPTTMLVIIDGEGHSYYARNAYDEIPLPGATLKGCGAMTVHVTIGGKHDDSKYNDLCDKCRLVLLKGAVAYLEQKVGGE